MYVARVLQQHQYSDSRPTVLISSSRALRAVAEDRGHLLQKPSCWEPIDRMSIIDGPEQDYTVRFELGDSTRPASLVSGRRGVGITRWSAALRRFLPSLSIHVTTTAASNRNQRPACALACQLHPACRRRAAITPQALPLPTTRQ
jgi:hypothetical protein